MKKPIKYNNPCDGKLELTLNVITTELTSLQYDNKKLSIIQRSDVRIWEYLYRQVGEDQTLYDISFALDSILPDTFSAGLN